MKALPRYPALFQVNTRVRLGELSRALGRRATLDDLPDAELDAFAADGFDLVWMLGVWQTGEAARRVSLGNAGWREEFRRALPDLADADVTGSPFAVRAYRVHDDFGGDEALARLRERLKKRGLRLVLDFVPNHVAPDHPWVAQRPDFFAKGSEEDLAAAPKNWTRTAAGILAHGRDPYFDGWPDTLQLDYGNPALQEAMVGELKQVASRCDGVRCDMAMLVLPDVFERTWGRPASPFWPRATAAVRTVLPEFLFLAEAYWDLEWTLQQQGFDWAYDKRLYDRLEQRRAQPVREHFLAGLDYQERLARFLENHDEPRAAAAYPPDVHRAAAVLTFLAPGLRFFHQGQREGKRVRISMHLGRGPDEPVDEALRAFYARLLATLKDDAFREGTWQLLASSAAWGGNASQDAFVAFAWTGRGERRHLVAVNYSDHQSQCFVGMPWTDLGGRTWRFQDRMGSATYDRPGGDLAERGLYLDVGPWAYHVFDVEPIGRNG